MPYALKDVAARIECCRRTGCFFFQAEDGIRDYKVTGVQTCALPIYTPFRSVQELGRIPGFSNPAAVGMLTRFFTVRSLMFEANVTVHAGGASRTYVEIGRASCRKSVDLGGRRIIKKKKTQMLEHAAR